MFAVIAKNSYVSSQIDRSETRAKRPAERLNKPLFSTYTVTQQVIVRILYTMIGE